MTLIPQDGLWIDSDRSDLERTPGHRPKGSQRRGYKPLIHRLPFELLTQVFIEVCRNTGLGPLYYTQLAPVTILALVCSLWRDVVVPNPILWSSFRFTAGNSFRTDNTKTLLPILRLFLRRSYPSDLAVCVQIQDGPQDDPCFDELALHSERWGHLHLDVFPRLIPKLNTVKNRVSALKTLSLQSKASRVSPSSDVVDAFEYAPLLRNVATRGVPPSALRIPWDQITDLTYDPPDSTGMEWAQQCSNLQSLTIYPTSLRNAHSIHPLLGQFTISLGLRSPPNALDISSCFTMPHLLSLKINSASPTKYFVWFHAEFLAFVARSPPFALREFILVNLYTDMTDDQLIECLRVLPSLQTLKILETYRKPLFTHEVCRALTRRAYDINDMSDEESSMHLSPMLTTLYLGEGLIVDPETLADMLESRSPHAGDPDYDELANLTSLTLGAVFWAFPRKNAAMARFKTLAARGLNISVIPTA
ncbi:hypothetical protein FPV67DRAFT_870948 [Lyophyllum atratum]|nr:hypothetical protein FPV67DRAFT_870948 [Lyophyllum atratum]